MTTLDTLEEFHRRYLQDYRLAEPRPRNPLVRRRVRKWVNALRSGDYKQGQHYLHEQETNTYCCLGVACDLYPRRKEIKTLERESVAPSIFVVGDTQSWTYMPRPVAKWLGFEQENPRVCISDRLDHVYTLGTLNDAGITLEEIADIIERSWLS